MIFTRLTSVFVLPAAVFAQYGGAPPSSGTTTSAAAPSAPSAPPDTTGQMNIDVAFNGQFMFHPNNISAAPGTLVTFWFPGGDIPHSVTQSSFEEPCTYLTANSSAETGAGFDSGLTNSVQFTLNVTDDQPPSSGSNTFQAFQAAAIKIGGSETAQTSGGPVTGGVHGVATATPAATGTSSSSSSSSSSSAITNVASMGFVLFAFVVSLILA